MIGGRKYVNTHPHLLHQVAEILICAQEIGTFRMTCVGYDAEFLRALQRGAPYFVPPTLKSKKRKQPKKGRKEKQERKAPTIDTKRKTESAADVESWAEAKSESDAGEVAA